MGIKELGLSTENSTLHSGNRLHVGEAHQDTEDHERLYICWSEIIEEFTFVVIYAKVIVEDCISREPRHLPEPTKEDRLLKRDYESDPEPAQDLETLAKAEAVLAQREETLWQIEELRRNSRVVKPTKRMEQ